MQDPQDTASPKIQIIVAAHREYRMPEDNTYIPLHVGKALHNNLDIGPTFIGDDSGESISVLNNYYFELTGLYWIGKMGPHFIVALFDSVIRSTTAHMFNMLIMKDEKLDEYCSWPFPILCELQHRINPSQYDAFNARYPGRISEIPLDAWINTNGYSYLELPVISTEPVNWAKKGTAFLSAKFAGKKYSSSF